MYGSKNNEHEDQYKFKKRMYITYVIGQLILKKEKFFSAVNVVCICCL